MILFAGTSCRGGRLLTRVYSGCGRIKSLDMQIRGQGVWIFRPSLVSIQSRYPLDEASSDFPSIYWIAAATRPNYVLQLRYINDYVVTDASQGRTAV